MQETREEKRREERAAADVIREEKGKCAGISHQTHVHTLRNEPSAFSSVCLFVLCVVREKNALLVNC